MNQLFPHATVHIPGTKILPFPLPYFPFFIGGSLAIFFLFHSHNRHKGHSDTPRSIKRGGWLKTLSKWECCQNCISSLVTDVYSVSTFSPYKTPLAWSLFPGGVPKISHEVVIAGFLLPLPTKKEKETISSFRKKTRVHWSSSLSFSATQLVTLTTIWLTSHVIHRRSWNFSILDEDTPSCDLSILLACQF